MSRAGGAPLVQQHHHQSASPLSPTTAGGRVDHITLARKAFGVSVDLSGLGPGNERVVAAELLLLELAGGAGEVLDVTRASVPIPPLETGAGRHRPATPLEVAAWGNITSYRQLWIQAWEVSDDLRIAEMKERAKLANVLRAAERKVNRQSVVQAAAWRLIEHVEREMRLEVMHEEGLVIEGLTSFFRTRKNEIEIRSSMLR